MMRNFSLLARFMTFRRELGALWRAFLTPATPLYLKALMLLVPLYLVMPLDLIPDVIPVLGWLDDAVIIPMLVSWIVSMLPRPQPVRAERGPDASREQRVIDGTWRRL